MAEVATVSCNPQQGTFELPGSRTHERLARAKAHYTTPQERELCLANLKWMSVLAPSHAMQMDCRMLLISMRNEHSFGDIKERAPWL